MKSFKCSAAILAIAAVVVAAGNAHGQQVTAFPKDVAITNLSHQSGSAATVTLTNSTGGPISVAYGVTGSGWTDALTGSCSNPQNFDGNGSCTVNLTFTNPLQTGSSAPETGALTFNFSGGPITVGLYGNPVTVSPNPLALTSTPPENSAANGTVTVTNTAPADANGSGYSVTLKNILDSSSTQINTNGLLSPSSQGFATTGGAGVCGAGTILNSAGTCTLNVSFTNPPDATGPETIPLTYDFTDSLNYIWSIADPIQGNPGAASTASVTSTGVAPTLLVFNNLSTSLASSPQSFTLSTTGPGTVSSVVVPTAAGFATASGSNCAGFNFGPGGGSCTLNLTFTNPQIPYGLNFQPAIGPQKGTVYFIFSDNSFVTGTVRGNPSPMSGALLTINGTASGSAVNLAIYDSQVHNNFVQLPGTTQTCTAFDVTFPTDAYLFQGGSWTGCDGGDAFEAQLTPGGAGAPNGTATLGNFTISTHYQCGPLFNNVCNAPSMCATSGTMLTVNGSPQALICSSDTGFVTVTNNGSAFNGTIQLAGQSTECGNITDSFTNLAGGASVTLALAADSSFCGGFEAQETLPITASQTTVFPFGQDTYKDTPFISASGDQVTFMVVPFPDNPVSDLNHNPNVALFDPGPNFRGYRCTPYTDLSAPSGNNPVCAGLQIGCVPGNASAANPTGDCETYIYTSELDYAVAPDDAENGGGSNQILNLGAPGFLGVHHENFPPPCDDNTGVGCYNLNTLVSYNGDCCVKISGGRDGSAHIDVWNPSFAPLSMLNTFTGFGSPIVDIGPDPSNPNVNVIKAGRAVPLPFTQDDTTGAPVTTLSLCPSLGTDGSSCSDPTVPAPWLVVQAYSVTCPNNPNGVVDNTTFPAGKSSLQNFSSTTPGSYQYNWKTPNNATGCARLVFTYDTGTAFLTPAEFQFK